MFQTCLLKRLMLCFLIYLFCVGKLQPGFWGHLYALNLPESNRAASQNPGSFTLLQVRRKKWWWSQVLAFSAHRECRILSSWEDVNLRCSTECSFCHLMKKLSLLFLSLFLPVIFCQQLGLNKPKVIQLTYNSSYSFLMRESGIQLFGALFLVLLWTRDPGQFSHALKDLNNIYLDLKNMWNTVTPLKCFQGHKWNSCLNKNENVSKGVNFSKFLLLLKPVGSLPWSLWG